MSICALSHAVVAQEEPVPDGDIDKSTAEQSDTSETEETDVKPYEDLDAFFEHGQEQAEEGSSCQPPPDPIA